MSVWLKGRCLVFLLASSHLVCGIRQISERDLKVYRRRVVDMFNHAYEGYMKYAFPLDELRPLTCDGQDTWGSFSLTLIDALDTLAIMGNYTEFRRVAQLLIDKANFDIDINASVFETNIRIVAGLLSAHLFSRQAGMVLEPGWPCSGPLLSLAENVARRLLPAFDTASGMPYGTINLKYGVPKGETTVTCTAGVGTFIVEFGTLSRLTGDPIFEKAALRALRALWDSRSDIGLVGNHIDVSTKKWTAVDTGVGGGVDSYFEYLVKGSIMFQMSELLEMFRAYEKSIEKYLKKEDWYMWGSMKKGSITLPVFTSLDAYWPGIQSMLGDTDKAMRTMHNFHQVWKQYGFLPEFYNIPKTEVHINREGYPLRPDVQVLFQITRLRALITASVTSVWIVLNSFQRSQRNKELAESAMYLYQATRDPFLLQVGIDMLESIEHVTKTSCGYATVKDVNDHRLENRMESFFLAETTKYLYLLFNGSHFIHNNGSHGDVVDTTNGNCIINTGGYVFNTEAHPIDMAAVYCCSKQKKMEDEALYHLHDNLDLMSLLGIFGEGDKFKGEKWERKNERLRRTKTENRKETATGGFAEKKTKFNNISKAFQMRGGGLHKSTNKNLEGKSHALFSSYNTLFLKQSQKSSKRKNSKNDWSGRAPTVQNLYKVLNNYSLNHSVKSQLLICHAQPFHMKMSLNGEVFFK